MELNEREAQRMEELEKEAEFFKNILKKYWLDNIWYVMFTHINCGIYNNNLTYYILKLLNYSISFLLHNKSIVLLNIPYSILKSISSFLN